MSSTAIKSQHLNAQDQTSVDAPLAVLAISAVEVDADYAYKLGCILDLRRRIICCICGGLGHRSSNCPLAEDIEFCCDGGPMLELWNRLKVGVQSRSNELQEWHTKHLAQLPHPKLPRYHK